jgi:hypothetical protein
MFYVELDANELLLRQTVATAIVRIGCDLFT